MQRITLRHISYPGKNKNNEDFLRYTTLSSGETVVVLADGMGGLSYGELAARTVVNAIFNTLVDCIATPSLNYSMEDMFHRAFEEADTKLKKSCYEKHCKMGTAVTALVIANDTLYFMGLGNVRLYRNTTEGFNLLTQDHVQKITSSQSYFLTRCINGKGFRKIPTIKKIPLNKLEQLYLCTDGYYQIFSPDTTVFNMDIGTTLSDFKDDCSLIEILLHSTH